MQGCDEVVRRQLDAIGEVMMRVLRTPPREGQNISEWAKQQACRETALRSEVPIIPGLEAWVVDTDTARSEIQETRATGEVDRDLQIMQDVLAIPPERWSALRAHARTARLIQPYDEAALRAACGEIARPPNEAQARRLLALVERSRETGWVFPEMRST